MVRNQLVFVLSWALLQSCGETKKTTKIESKTEKTCVSTPSAPKSPLGIVDGSATSSFPAVNLLLSPDGQNGSIKICTGTFVSKNTMLTAAHCLDESKSGGVLYIDAAEVEKYSVNDSSRMKKLVATGVAPTKIFRSYVRKKDGSNDQSLNVIHDLAILFFDGLDIKNTLPILNKKPEAGAPVTLIGYGFSDQDNSSATDIQKREGASVIAAWQPKKDRIQIVSGDTTTKGVVTTGSKYSYTAKGDSGSPLIVEGAISGVLSGGHALGNGVDSAIYVDINSSDSINLLNEAEKGGAKFEYASNSSGSNINQADSSACK